MSEPDAVTYAAAGVDIDAGDRAVALMRESVARATRPEVVGGIGGFAGLFDARALAGMAHPLLATSTDGVGTKVVVAQRMDVHDTIGQDLVAMLVVLPATLVMPLAFDGADLLIDLVEIDPLTDEHLPTSAAAFVGSDEARGLQLIDQPCRTRIPNPQLPLDE